MRSGNLMLAGVVVVALVYKFAPRFVWVVYFTFKCMFEWAWASALCIVDMVKFILA